MASHPWIVPHERQGQRLEDFPNLERCFEAVKNRAATMRAHARGKSMNMGPSASEEKSRQVLFGQSAATVR
jgi:GST-like protein